MSKRSNQPLCAALALSLGIAASTLAQTYVPLPFEDTFANGVQTDSNSEVGIWSSVAQNAYGKLEETGGNWVFTCGPAGSINGTAAAGSRRVTATAGAGEKQFNVLDPDFGMRVRGLSFEFLAGNGPQTGTVRTVQAAYIDISFYSDGTSSTLADDALSLVIYGNGRFIFGNKVNHPVYNAEYNGVSRAIDYTTPGNAPITGYDFWLDEPEAGAYKRCNVTIYYGENQSYSTNAALKTPFTAADWNNGGAARLNIYGERYYATDPEDSVRVTIGSFEIVPFRGPAILLFGKNDTKRPIVGPLAALRAKTELN